MIDQEIKSTMDYKNKQVKKAMDAKDKSIAISSSGRDATLMVNTLVEAKVLSPSKVTLEGLKNEIKEWRNWFYYEIYTRDPDEDLKREGDPF